MVVFPRLFAGLLLACGVRDGDANAFFAESVDVGASSDARGFDNDGDPMQRCRGMLQGNGLRWGECLRVEDVVLQLCVRQVVFVVLKKEEAGGVVLRGVLEERDDLFTCGKWVVLLMCRRRGFGWVFMKFLICLLCALCTVVHQTLVGINMIR